MAVTFWNSYISNECTVGVEDNNISFINISNKKGMEILAIMFVGTDGYEYHIPVENVVRIFNEVDEEK